MQTKARKPKRTAVDDNSSLSSKYVTLSSFHPLELNENLLGSGASTAPAREGGREGGREEKM